VRIAIYPASFDPLHLGHLDVARRAARIFDRLVFAVSAMRGAKSPLFTPEERVALARAALADLPGVVVDSYSGLTVDYARRVGAIAMVRGVRTVSDYDNEFALAHMNTAMAPEVETVIFMASARYAFISSSLIKQVALAGGDVGSVVPPPVEQALRRKFAERA
jgi:pantetheine-phosphate adenylyltransferase